MKRLVFIIGCIIAIGLFSVLSIFFTLIPRPKIDGTIHMDGLLAPVKVVRDNHGIPYIKAENEKDLFFAMGFVNAQDRLWQMELLRRISQGRMAEIFGEEMVQNDIFLKTIGLDEIGKKQLRATPGEILSILQSFVDGINRGIQTSKKKPLEFYLLNIDSKPWKVEDCFTIFELLMWQLSYNFKFETILGGLVKKLGARKALSLVPPDGTVTYEIANAYDKCINQDFAFNITTYENFLKGASNAWIVTGDKTTTGTTYIASDSHLSSVGFPSPFYIIHGEYPGVEFTGMMLPGVPCVLLGANKYLTWVITNNGADVQDLFLEKLKDNEFYLYKNQWKPLTERDITIQVKKKGDIYHTINHTVKKTIHGPIIKTLDNGQAISLQWCDMDDVEGYPGLVAFYQLLKCRTGKEFTAILREYEGIPLNFLYADTKGFIAHRTVGKIPKREKGHGSLPSKGWEGENDWKEFISFDELPQKKLSSKRYLFVTNDKIDSPSGIYIPGIYSPDSRSMRIKQLLESRDSFSLQDIMDMQMDVRSLICKNIWNYVYPILKELDNPDIRELVSIMKNWEGDHHKDAAQPLIFNAFLEQLLFNVFEDEIKREEFPGYFSHWYYFIDRFYYFLTSDDGDEWFDNKETSVYETKKEIIQQSFMQTAENLKRKLGNDIEEWEWGDSHTITFTHFLGKKGIFAKFLNCGPYAYEGGIDTINRASYTIGTDFVTNFATCCRMIVDLGDIEKVYFVISTGQSGNILSSYARDQLKLFLQGSYIEVDARMLNSIKDKHVLTIKPN